MNNILDFNYEIVDANNNSTFHLLYLKVDVLNAVTYLDRTPIVESGPRSGVAPKTI